jgi:hypothetical protein
MIHYIFKIFPCQMMNKIHHRNPEKLKVFRGQRKIDSKIKQIMYNERLSKFHIYFRLEYIYFLIPSIEIYKNIIINYH